MQVLSLNGIRVWLKNLFYLLPMKLGWFLSNTHTRGDIVNEQLFEFPLTLLKTMNFQKLKNS